MSWNIRISSSRLNSHYDDYSAGGFSNYFSLPSYQAPAVQTYYKKHNPGYGSNRYNNNQKARGYPDVRCDFFLVSLGEAFRTDLFIFYSPNLSANGLNCEWDI